MKISEIVKEHDKVIFDFFADWCAPCKAMEPELLKIKDNTEIFIVSVDINENEDLATLFGVQSIPTTVYYKDGKQIKIKIGFQSYEEMIKTLS